MKDSLKIYFAIVSVVFLILLVMIRNNKVTDMGEDEYNFEEIEKYETNQIIPVVVDDKKIAQVYLNKFIKEYGLNPNDSYKMIDESQRFDKFDTLDKYLNFMKRKESTYFFMSEIKYIDVKKFENKKHIFIIDSDDNEFEFIENKIMDFTVIVK